ncbi:MAG: NAD(P)-dependent oxidoreductase [Candidatus Symbiobacter sp.]|nr:NAD(P)-dependent oxidoreductase [Candidatus Symbiobacter sp.]
MTPRKLAIIGDRFMLPQAFADGVTAALPPSQQGAIALTQMQQPWPDVPMAHGYETGFAPPRLSGLKEYLGDPDDIIAFVRGAEMLITHLAPLSAEILADLPDLRFVGVSRGGPVNVDVQAARARGIRLVNVPGRNASAVAEFTIGAILAETRKIRSGHETMRQGIWQADLYRADRTGRELSEMVVGVVGYGQVGSKLVKLLRAFGCKILVSDPYVQLSADDHAAGVELVSLDRLLAESDVVSLHARVTAETTKFIDQAAFARMKTGVIFVNTARGPLVDYAALDAAMNSDKIAGCMLDTFELEPPPVDLPLLRHPKLTLTPHIAGASVRTVTFAATKIAEEVRRYLMNEPPLNPC